MGLAIWGISAHQGKGATEEGVRRINDSDLRSHPFNLWGITLALSRQRGRATRWGAD
jgi:hypothetical protein